MWVAGQGAGVCASADRFVVHVNLSFDRSIRGDAIRSDAQAEAAAIWRKYGVDIVWAEPDAIPDLCLDAFVERNGSIGLDGSAAVLGHAVVGRAVVERPANAPEPIRVALGAIDALVGAESTGPKKRHDHNVATALGRVLAHEIGHVLLGAPAYHDPSGLMRATFHADEFVEPERTRFVLMDGSVARLRARMAILTRRDAFPGAR